MEIEEREVETEEDEEEEEEKKEKIVIPEEVYNSEMKKLQSNPREYISDWMEGNLLHVGKKLFNVLCLLPCSMVIPNILFKSSDIRSNINVFIIGPPAAGKSKACEKFNSFSYCPINIKGISAKKLIQRIEELNGFFSLTADDFSNLLTQPDGYELIKILEGALGDEQNTSHENMKYSIKIKTHAVGVVCGTWTDLKKYHNYLRGGFLSRTSLMFVSLTYKQREEIVRFINDGIGNSSDSNDSRIKEQIIKDYYQLLFKIQSSPNPVKGYIFDEKYKGMAMSSWIELTKDYANDITGDFKREFQDFYRFVVSHAFLNYYERKVVDGMLHPSKEDYEYALELMKKLLLNKISLIQSDILLKRMDSPKQLIEVINNPGLKEDAKNILMNLSPYANSINNSNGK